MNKLGKWITVALMTTMLFTGVGTAVQNADTSQTSDKITTFKKDPGTVGT